MLAVCWHISAYVGRMLHLCWPMLAYAGRTWRGKGARRGASGCRVGVGLGGSGYVGGLLAYIRLY